jgi:hypothetical protein
VSYFPKFWGLNGEKPVPPELPEYNGSCEAGIGSMKTRTFHAAVRHGRPGDWTCEDLEIARQEANQTARPWGVNGPTPQEAWLSRQPVAAKERSAFAVTVQRQEAANGETDEQARRRQALAQALLSHGLLEFWSGSVLPRLPVRGRKA